MAKADVNEDCIGCGVCADVCPEVFELQDDGLAHVIIDEVKDEWVDTAKEAEGQCPVSAITVDA